MTDRVRIYVVTYRRPHLLERALRSLIGQSHKEWVAEILNDDPSDPSVAQLALKLGDARIQVSQPSEHRGGTRNFNYAFRTVDEPFASILEDDNWWEPGFLSTMLAALGGHPGVALACGNEHIWLERLGDQWTDTGRNVWQDTAGERLLNWNALDQCGSAMLCNSSMLFRTKGSDIWRTPESIPIDVTEHFRQRVVPHPLLLVYSPLANYSQTLATHRTRAVSVWARYQVMLVGSVFALAQSACRKRLASALWVRARTKDPLYSTTLISTGLLVPAARELWHQARFTEKARFSAGILRHPRTAASLYRGFDQYSQEWAWLQQGAFAEFMSRDPTFLGDT
jgi:glycosyltransferase involved in cell wall biosynthesis